MIYGNPIIHIEDDQTDRIGIRTLILSQFWQTPRANMTLADIDGAEPSVPGVPGGVAFIGRQRKAVRGGFRTYWTFEGIDGSGKDVSFKNRTNSPDFSFQPGFAQMPIQLHPSFQALKDNYAGTLVDNTVVWQPTLPSQSQQSGATKDNSAGQPNPMFGRQDFYSVQGTYSFRYASLTPPSTQGFGTIAGALPGSPPTFSDRNWFYAGAPYQHRGVIYDITEIYWLSDAGSWPELIYSIEAMSGDISSLSGGDTPSTQNYKSFTQAFSQAFGGSANG